MSLLNVTAPKYTKKCRTSARLASCDYDTNSSIRPTVCFETIASRQRRHLGINIRRRRASCTSYGTLDRRTGGRGGTGSFIS